MSYEAIVEIATSISLTDRVTACAATEQIEDPVNWTRANMWKIAAQPGWAADWDYAKDAYIVNQNPDTGARIDVINDDKILAAVQAVRAAEEPPVEEPQA